MINALKKKFRRFIILKKTGNSCTWAQISLGGEVKVGVSYRLNERARMMGGESTDTQVKDGDGYYNHKHYTVLSRESR